MIWQWFFRLATVSFLGLIFLAIPKVPNLYPTVDGLLRTPMFLWIIKTTTFLLLCLGMVMLFTRRLSWQKLLGQVLVLVPFILYVLDHDNPSERDHLLQYFILSFLLLASFPGLKGWRTLLPLVCALLLGWADEKMQSYLPNRYFDWEDIRLDAKGSLAGFLQAWFLLYWRGFFWPRAGFRSLIPNFKKMITTL